MATSSINLLYTNNPIIVKKVIKKVMVKNTNGSYSFKAITKIDKYINALVKNSNGSHSVQSVNLRKVKRKEILTPFQQQLLEVRKNLTKDKAA